MSKSKFIREFEINASVRMLYPYLNTADGLAKWFADDVNLDPKRFFTFIWNGDKVMAKKHEPKPNHHVKFTFTGKDGKEIEDPSYIEFKLEENEMTQTSFLQIIDYSEIEDKSDMEELYDHLVLSLKEIVGG
jgi:uncharacterized protein YndB with AHSA1/START domain